MDLITKENFRKKVKEKIVLTTSEFMGEKDIDNASRNTETIVGVFMDKINELINKIKEIEEILNNNTKI